MLLELLSILRNPKTEREKFRSVSSRLAHLLAAQAAEVHATRVVLVPVLRAGMALLPAFLTLFPNAPIGFFGIRRDEKTAAPHLYYEKLHSIAKTDTVFLLDPMIATGGTACLALKHLKQKGAEKIFLFGVIAATEGMKKVSSEHPDVAVFVCAEDSELNAQKMIVPGLGDFGDRYFT